MDNVKLNQLVIKTVEAFLKTPLVPVGVSNRHIHLSQKDLEELFGKGYTLTPTKPLQPGQFACQETVKVTGAKDSFGKVRILGPVRKETQLEISMTDSFTLGINAPVCESGELKNAVTVTVENPENGVRISRACAIIALRHIHLTPEFAARHNLQDKQMASMEFESGNRSICFKDVLLRVSPNYHDEIHIDTDEANAGGIKNGDLGRIII